MIRRTRRQFLRDIGAGVAMLPLLEPRRAHAAFPKRLVVMYKTNGTILEDFFPTTPGPLTSLPAITKPLEPFKDQLLFLGALQATSHIDSKGDYTGHDANYTTLTGFKDGVAGPSFDQYVADELVKRVSLPRKLLCMGVYPATGDDLHYKASFRGPTAANTPEVDPWKLADSLLGGAAGTPSGAMGMTPTMPTTSPTPTAPDPKRLRRASVLDYVGKDLERYRRTLGTADRQKVEAHLESVREIERQLGALAQPAPGSGGSIPAPPTGMTAPPSPGGSCGKPALPARVGLNGWSKTDVMNYPMVAKAQMDVLAALLCADVTRVVNFMWTDAFGSNLVFHWLTDRGGAGIVNNDYHEITHNYPKNDADRGYKRVIETWFMEQIAYFLGKLQSIPEGNGTMLDNTAVMLVDPMGNGSVHRVVALPWFVAGRCGGALKTGQFINYGVFGSKSYDASYKFVNHNGAFVAVANAMDIPCETFGDPAYGGELPGIRG